MKLFYKFTVWVLAIVGFSGCVSSQLMNQLAVGMTKEQVERILGSPDSTSVQADVEYLSYNLPLVEDSGGSEQMNLLRIGMSEDDVVANLGQPGSTSAQGNVKYLVYYLLTDGYPEAHYLPYLVRLVGGKTESFGRAYELDDLYRRAVTDAMPGEQAFPGAVPASGELAFPRRRRLPLLGYPYLVRIVAGRVESFGRLEQLYDTYGRPVTNFEPGEPGFPQAVPVVLGPRPEAPSRSAASTGSGLVDRLQTLQGLRDSGVLSPEEFQAAKARLLSP